MSKARQPYVTLKQFIDQLQQSPSKVTHLRVKNYWRVMFTATSQEHKDVNDTSDWNALNLGIAEHIIPLNDLLDHLKSFLGAHSEAAVTLNNQLIDELVLHPTTKANVLFKDTLLNKPPISISLDEFVTGLNAIKVDRPDLVLALAVEKFQDDPIIVFRVGTTWLTKDALYKRYPKLWNQQFHSRFTEFTCRGHCVMDCKVSETKMQDDFGEVTLNQSIGGVAEKPDDLIERLLKEAKMTSK